MKDNFNFAEEFRKLFMTSPQCGSWTRASENCDYGDITTVSKDCYMCFNSGNCRDAYYCEDSRALKNCTDCAFCEGCELSYECVDCNSCYNSDFCQDCTNCRDIYYSYDLRRCQDCFGCVTLRDKKYCIFNEQYSREEFEKKLAELKKMSLEDIEATLEKLKLKMPRMYVHQHDTQNCAGDYIYHSKNCYMCFDTRHTEDSGYINQANLDIGAKDSWDCSPCPTGVTLCYDVTYVHYLFNCKHLYWCGNLKDCQWSANCFESEHLFGCHYLKNKQKNFYILNEKVSEEYYLEKTEKIAKELWEYGIYTLYDLLNKDLSAPKIEINENPANRRCAICGNSFDLIPKEIEFYKKHKIAWPIYCFVCRAKQRFNLRNERKMHKRVCDGCKKSLISTYPPNSKFIVYCLNCYWKNIG